MARTRSTTSIDARILRRMRASKNGAVFTPGRFLDFGSRTGIDQALSRLARNGLIRRCGRGLYDIARSHPWFGILAPDPRQALAALAARRGIQLRPAGAEAANLLGLSEQVPAKFIYLTSGRSGKIRLAGHDIELKHGSSRHMALSPRPTGLIVSAMESLGDGHITELKLQRLHRDLPEADRRTLLREMPLTPAWMRPWLHYLATGGGIVQ